MLTYGYAITGSFCTFRKSIEQIKLLVESGINILPIMSFNAYSIDTRFGKAANFISEIEKITGNRIIASITDAEPIGPQNLLDLLIVSPCTGNTLGKLANGIADTPVTLAVKAHLRNEKPVLIGVSSNDSLSNSASNIGKLLNNKLIFFIPMSQDDFSGKPRSVVCDFLKTSEAAQSAVAGKQLQPILI